MLILGHRGAKAYAPENTLPAYQKAIELGADGVELDVHLSKDGEMVICHDFSVKNTSNGTGLIREMTLAELRQLDFGSYFSPEFQGTRIPTLREALCTVRGMRCINIEIKSAEITYPGLPRKVAGLVKELALTDRVIVSSFDHKMALQAKESLPQLRAGLLYERVRIPHPAEYCKSLGADAMHPQAILVRRRDVEECRQAGICVNVWTVNRGAAAQKLLRWGCSCVITNVPDVIRRALEFENNIN